MKSTLARMLRKVLRVHEHGVTHQAVLDRAGVNIIGDLRQQIANKVRALGITGHQAQELMEPAVHRLSEVGDELIRVAELPMNGLIEVDREGEEVFCSVCGLEFHNQKSLEAHYTSKHPEIHTQARTPFDRREHTLFGITTMSTVQAGDVRLGIDGKAHHGGSVCTAKANGCRRKFDDDIDATGT